MSTVRPPRNAGEGTKLLFNGASLAAALQVAALWVLSGDQVDLAFTGLLGALLLGEAALVFFQGLHVPVRWFFSFRGMRKAGTVSPECTVFFYYRVVMLDFIIIWWMVHDAAVTQSKSTLTQWVLQRLLFSCGHLHSGSSLAVYLAWTRLAPRLL